MRLDEAYSGGVRLRPRETGLPRASAAVARRYESNCPFTTSTRQLNGQGKGGTLDKRSFRFSSAIVAGAALLLVAAVKPPDFGDPLPGLTSDEMDRFAEGQDDFEEVETVDTGLGPVFNDVSCASCHNVPAVGGGSQRLVTRFGRIGTSGDFDSLPGFGGSLIQSQGIGAAGTCMYLAEIVPPDATVVSGRRSTPLFGLGLVDAVPDADLVALAASESHDPDGIGGAVSHVTNVATGLPDVGRFGWKAQVPTLMVFAADAYVNEMGITNPLFPNENCPQGDCAALSCNPHPEMNDDGEGVRKLADYMTMLGPPPRGPISGAVTSGESTFVQIGCASCHKATLKTGPSAIKALNKVTFHPYSDFLLHDMGSLGDGISQNEATGKLMRTAPLWGLRKQATLLHDGRATTIEQAILAHDGQGKKARDRFAALKSLQKSQILAFLNSL